MSKIRGLYYITHIDNIPSILEKGILCRRIVEGGEIKFTSIDNRDIVSRRRNIKLPNGKSLWDYANLFFQPRNAMLYRVITEKGVMNIAVIEVSNRILDRDDIFITDGNAASLDTKIFPKRNAQKVIENIVEEIIGKDGWTEENRRKNKRKFMAECLVPERVPAEYITKIYVADSEVKRILQTKIKNINIPIVPKPDLFLPSDNIETEPLEEFLFDDDEIPLPL